MLMAAPPAAAAEKAVVLVLSMTSQTQPAAFMMMTTAPRRMPSVSHSCWHSVARSLGRLLRVLFGPRGSGASGPGSGADGQAARAAPGLAGGRRSGGHRRRAGVQGGAIGVRGLRRRGAHHRRAPLPLPRPGRRSGAPRAGRRAGRGDHGADRPRDHPAPFSLTRAAATAPGKIGPPAGERAARVVQERICRREAANSVVPWSATPTSGSVSPVCSVRQRSGRHRPRDLPPRAVTTQPARCPVREVTYRLQIAISSRIRPQVTSGSCTTSQPQPPTQT